MSKIEDLKSKISGQKVLLKKYEKANNEKLVSKMKKYIEKDSVLGVIEKSALRE